jgi:TRAP transporter TAXI family solute receptor
VLILAGWFGPALAQDVGIITGSEKGTYYRFGLDLQKLLKPSGINVTVHPSRGSVDNIYAVYQRPGVQLGVVQADVLAFITRVQSNPLLMQIAKKTRLVFPLYNEEIHLVGKRGIRDFDDLAGKRVAIGRDGSGTYLTSRILFKLSEVQAEFVLIDTAEALAELKAGRIDAMLYVAGAPVGLFKDDVTEADGLALIPITNKSIGEFYPQVEIPARMYSWQPDVVNTVAVKAVLISYDFRRKDCDTVGKVAQLTNAQIETLRKGGHAKWKVVDLDAQVKGWEQYDCVRKYLGRATPATAAKKRTSDNPVLDAIKQMLDD